MECFTPYFALIIMFYHVKIACYQSSPQALGNKKKSERFVLRVNITKYVAHWGRLETFVLSSCLQCRVQSVCINWEKPNEHSWPIYMAMYLFLFFMKGKPSFPLFVSLPIPRTPHSSLFTISMIPHGIIANRSLLFLIFIFFLSSNDLHCNLLHFDLLFFSHR